MSSFSVIIPTYNRAALIEKTIRSVLDQGEGEFEIIVIDDGGTDDTGEVIAAIGDSRIRYHHKQNGERAAARNVGTAVASGDYVTFLDSDDLFYKDHLRHAAEMIEKRERPEWFHLGYEIADDEGNRIRPCETLPDIANELLTGGNCLSCRGVFIRRDIGLKHPFNEDRALSGTEDYELWLRLASRYPLYCDRRITSAIVQHDRRSVINTSRDDLFTRIELLERYLAEDPTFVEAYGDRLGEFKANNRIYIALHLALARTNRFEAVSLLFRSLGLCPKALRNRAFYGTIKRIFIPV
jgi:glycosyltransferase involved in cell wall biosynthesis